MVVHNEIESSKEAFVMYSEVLTRRLFAISEETDEKRQSKQSVFRPRFIPRTLPIEVGNVKV
jgi:hypothetical protein